MDETPPGEAGQTPQGAELRMVRGAGLRGRTRIPGEGEGSPPGVGARNWGPQRGPWDRSGAGGRWLFGRGW